MNVGSLFSGIGGIELGFEAAGFKTEWFVECEPYAQAVLKKRFPSTIIYDDVKTIDWRTVPKVDILTGGFPCQDISNAGKREGIKGSRSSLWKHYLEAIRELRPKVAVIENVSALTERGLNVVLSDLAKIRYDAEWYNISASSVGALHRRERLFIFAYPNSSGLFYGQTQEQSTERRKQTLSEPISSSSDVSNSGSCRCDNGVDNREGRLIQDIKERSITKDKQEGDRWLNRFGEICKDDANTNMQRLEGQHESEHSSRESKETFRWRGYWATEPNLGRVANGVSNRVDRIKCLGNAVVPQVAEVIAKTIKEHTKSR